jgi:hypothetical protein
MYIMQHVSAPINWNFIVLYESELYMISKKTW